MGSFRERNDRRSPSRPALHGGKPQGRHGPRGRGRDEDAAAWIWGAHAVEAALNNRARPDPERILATAERAEKLGPLRPGVRVEVMENGEIARHLPPGASHQGVAVRTPPLEGLGIDDLAEGGSGFLVMLDQVTDPQNVGAIFRSAAAFGAGGLILQDRHAPPLSGALTKAAAGAVERVPCARVVNLSRALDRLSDLGWLIVGLAGEGSETLADAMAAAGTRPVVLVMGSEGEGMRRLVAEHCDVVARIPMPGGFESLNVASAAAVALYEASRRVGARVTGERG